MAKATDVTKVRKAALRKSITAEIRAIQKIEAALVKARVAIEANSDQIKGDTFNQLTAVFDQIGVAIAVTDSAVQDKAWHLAQTFTK
jgi:hypothetical protein